MKKFKLYLLLLSLLFSGCIKEYLVECPVTDNVRLDFVYRGDGLDDIMMHVVNSVNVYVYDGQGNNVLDTVVNRTALKNERGVSFTLAQGEYRVVCWGNIADNTQASGEDRYETAVVHHRYYGGSSRMVTHDPLYYGACDRLIVPSDNASVKETVGFRSGHIDMEIYVRGAKIGPQFLPVVEIAGLYPEYDFTMSPTIFSRAARYNTATYHPSCSYDEGKSAAVASLSSARFASGDPVEIVLRNEEGGDAIFSLPLKRFLADNGIRVEEIQECRIPVQISFNQDLSVEVTIPEWETPDVKPEL